MKCLVLEESVHNLVECVNLLGKPKKRIILVGLQNGVKSLEMIKLSLGDHADSFIVVGGIVGFGVRWRDNATFQQTTEYALYFEKPTNISEDEQINFDVFVHAIRSTGFDVIVKNYENMREIMYGKLLVNLINAINAFSGVNVGTMLDDKYYRLIWGACIREGLEIYDREGIVPANTLKLPIRFLPIFLGSNIIFYFVAKFQKQERDGYSSMAQDIQKGRKTEINFLNGELVDLAEKSGISAPLNEKIIKVIKNVEKQGFQNTKSGKEWAKELGVPIPGFFSVDTFIILGFIAVLVFVFRFWFM